MCLCLTNSSGAQVSHLVPELMQIDVKRGQEIKNKRKMHERRRRNKQETRKRKEYISVGMNYSDISKKSMQPHYCCHCRIIIIITFTYNIKFFYGPVVILEPKTKKLVAHVVCNAINKLLTRVHEMYQHGKQWGNEVKKNVSLSLSTLFQQVLFWPPPLSLCLSYRAVPAERNGVLSEAFCARSRAHKCVCTAKIMLIKVVELKTLWKRLGRWTNVPFCNVTIKSWLTTAGYISAHSVLGLINFLYEVYSLSVRFNNSQSPQFLSSSLKQANGLRMAQEETLPPEMRYSTVYTAQC